MTSPANWNRTLSTRAITMKTPIHAKSVAAPDRNPHIGLPSVRSIILLSSSALLMLLSSMAHSAAPTLSHLERQIVSAATTEDERAIAFVETLVNINSGTMNPAGVERVGKIMAGELEKLGFTTRWHSMNAVERAGHLIAEHHGNGHGKRVLLIGHLDTVFERDSAFQRYQRRGNIAEGPGVCDMKGGLAIMVGALRALQTAGALSGANVTIVLDGDEENAGSPISVSRADLIEAAKSADVALEFESLATENGHDMGSVSRRGAVDWTLRTSSASGHSSDIFSADAGFGASYELARILDAFRRELREPNATYNVGLVLSGSTASLNSETTGVGERQTERHPRTGNRSRRPAHTEQRADHLP